MDIDIDTIRQHIGMKKLQRDESFAALQQVEQSANGLRQRIVLLDGALAQLQELEALAQRE
jgi:hypothetical protein